MNPRQRRGLLLLSVAAAGALAVFVIVAGYVGSVSSQVGPTATAYRFTKPVARLAPIRPADLEQVEIPERWLPEAAIQSFDAERGLVATQDVPAGALLQQGMAGPPPELKPGQREIAIMINAETGVAGKIQPGDLVDIYATFSSQEATRDGSRTLSQARVVVANAPVLAIGALRPAEATGEAEGGQSFQPSQVVPVTFALGREDALRIAYAESFATKLRLALIAPGSRSAAVPNRDVLRSDQIFGTPRPAAGR